MCSGTSPRNGTPRRSASWRAPPWPKMSERSPQCGQMNVDMFSTMPSTGTLVRLNMPMPRRASISAKSCGVETMIAPLSGTCCVSGELRPRRCRAACRSVDLAPLDLAQHLGERRHHHRPVPDHRRLFLDEQADRNHLEVVAVHGLEPRAADG